ncbi:olfactory receptor 5I1-like [Spea bombifrons]|uniref:olfactory receptor 5I1-like n=1 Tax=Spea bombifrons TaxID=233779 RepID=UPI00234B1D68|nr:olfactory receptor 5I1-like [Spea bombifrons]
MELSNSINSSRVTEFILIDFCTKPEDKIVFFLLFSLMYMMTVFGNGGIIFLVYHNTQLHTPMYCFITSLSFLDLCYSSDIVPKMLVNFLSEKKSISYIGCAVQLFVFCFLGSAECFLFAVMAYDRYVAICKPLNYVLVMQTQTCVSLISVAYAAGFLHSVIEICCTFSLSFCSSNTLHHFACDFPPLLDVSCTDTSLNEWILFILSSAIIISSIFIILMSYVTIFTVILKMKSNKGRKKAFSTCVSHIMSVTLLFGTLTYAYLSPKSKSSNGNGAVATVFYAVVMPLLNPMIYSFRNKDIISVLKSTLHVRDTFGLSG